MKARHTSLALVITFLIVGCSKKSAPSQVVAETPKPVVNAIPKPEPLLPKSPQEIFDEADYLAYITVEILLDPKDPSSYRRGVGSGFLIEYENNFYVLTAAHLCPPFGEVKKVWVRLKDKEFNRVNLEVTFTGIDRVLDIAVLAFKEKPDYKGKVAKLGKSEEVKTGDESVALGAPNTVPNCLSAGLIENQFVGIDEDTGHPGLIQHGASARPGNSGGPLLNRYGEVIGINIRVFGGNPGNWATQAVPIDDVKSLMPKIINTDLTDWWPHMMLQMNLVNSWDVTPYSYERMGLKTPDKPGLVITRIPAVFAELYKDFKVGDLILEINGEKVKDVGRFYHQTMTDISLPDDVEFLIERDGKEEKLKAPLLPFFK